jgi:type II secretory pathway pseudopilin PulG
MSESAESGRSKFKVSLRGWIALLSTFGVFGLLVFLSYGGDYTHLAQNNEAVSLLAGTKTRLSEYFQEKGKWPDSLDNIVENTSGNYTKSIEITKGAGEAGEIELTATMRTEGVDRRVSGRTILMTSLDGGKNWTCKRGTMREDHMPVQCRAK